jgi:chromosome segregation ATPase
MDLTQEEKDELKNYPNGSKFMLLYEEELARVKELQAQILTFDANLERVQTIADNWKKEQDRTLEQDLQPIEGRLDKVKDEIKKWTESELQRQLDQITQFERSKNSKVDRIKQIEKELEEKKREIENATEEIHKLKNPEEAKKKEEAEKARIKQIEEENKRKASEERRAKEEADRKKKQAEEDAARKQHQMSETTKKDMTLDSIASDLDSLDIEQDLLGLNLENPVTEVELMNKIIQDFDEKVKFLDQIADVLRD